MSKKIIISFLFSFVLLVSGCSLRGQASINNTEKQTETNALIISSNKNDKELSASTVLATADKLQIYYFHRTQRCYTCLTIGRYVREVLEGHFANQIKLDKIDFREINIELPENFELAKKFKASGSALFINAIRGGQDDIKQDTVVWRLIGDEDQFKKYLEQKISTLLGN